MAKFHNKDKIIYQQDLAPWHTYNMMKAKVKKIKLKALDWAAKHSDLNPIELFFGVPMIRN